MWVGEPYGNDAATLYLISAGRLIVGPGSSGPQVSERWHGVPFANQLVRTREYVDVAREVIARAAGQMVEAA